MIGQATRTRNDRYIAMQNRQSLESEIYTVPIFISKVINEIGRFTGFYPHTINLYTEYDSDLGFDEQDRFDLAEHLERVFLPIYKTIPIDDLLKWDMIYDTAVSIINALELNGFEVSDMELAKRADEHEHSIY